MDIRYNHSNFHTNFTSKRKDSQSFENFEELNREEGIDRRLHDILSDKNCVGEGRFNKIYRIPESDDYMIKAFKGINPTNVYEYKTVLTKTEDLFPKINVGQPIASLGRYLLVMLKQNGKEYSVPFTHRENLSPQDKEKYLSDLRKLAHMPQESFNNFTDEVKELTEKGCYIDYFNSNNIMTTKDEINTVDIIRIKHPKQRIFMYPSKESFMKIFTDENILPVIQPLLKQEELLELSDNVRQISKKTSRAMEQSGLPENKIITNIIDYLLDTVWHGQNKKFKKALSLLKNT